MRVEGDGCQVSIERKNRDRELSKEVQALKFRRHVDAPSYGGGTGGVGNAVSPSASIVMQPADPRPATHQTIMCPHCK